MQMLAEPMYDVFFQISVHLFKWTQNNLSLEFLQAEWFLKFDVRASDMQFLGCVQLTTL